MQLLNKPAQWSADAVNSRRGPRPSRNPRGRAYRAVPVAGHGPLRGSCRPRPRRCAMQPVRRRPHARRGISRRLPPPHQRARLGGCGRRAAALRFRHFVGDRAARLGRREHRGLDCVEISPDRNAYPYFWAPDNKRPGPALARASGTPVRMGSHHVEVAGIEPASFGTSPGLLRAQPALAFLSPGVHAGESPTGSATVCCPV